MKKCIIIALAAVLLTGCSQPEDFETMSDLYYEPEKAEASSIELELPENAALAVVGSEEAGKIYLCADYTVAVQTLESGDLDGTTRTLTGYGREEVQMMELQVGNFRRYECVWTSAGEGGDQVGRAVILDDGNYHYTLTVMGPADMAGQLAQTWQEILDSFTLRTAS